MISFVKFYFLERYENLMIINTFRLDLQFCDCVKLLINVDFKNKNLELYSGNFDGEDSLISLLQKQQSNIKSLKFKFTLMKSQGLKKSVLKNVLNCCNLYNNASLKIEFHGNRNKEFVEDALNLIKFVKSKNNVKFDSL